MSEVVIYQDEHSQTGVSVRLDGETVWLTQRQMAELLDASADNVSLHLKNISSEGELGKPATTEDFSVVQTEGRRKVTRTVRHCNLDAIISVGYRVNSKRGVQFRQWATRVLRDHLVRGHTFNQARLAERGLLEARTDREYWSRLVESAMGAPLSNAAAFKPQRKLLAGGDGIPVDKFLTRRVAHSMGP